MAAESRNRTVLLALLAVLVAVAAYQWWPRPSSVSAPTSNERARGQTASRGTATTAEAPVVHLPRLGEERPKPVAGERNLFRFKPKAAPAPTPGLAPAAPLPPTTPPPDFNRPTTPPITLRYIGYVDRGAGKPKMVAFVDASGHPINCLEGGDCDGRYHIWRVGAESVEISYLDGTGRRTLRQGGG